MDCTGSRPSRRRFVQGVGLAGLGLLVSCVGPFAPTQLRARVPRLGFLAPPGELATNIEAFREGLREYGYMEGHNLVVEWRLVEAGSEGFPALAAELVALNVDIIIAIASTIRPVMEATRTIPIVILNALDPVGAGYVASLARPGGNVTGLSNLAAGLSRKRLELLKDTVPEVLHLAALWSGRPGIAPVWEETQVAAQALGVRLRSLAVGERPDLASAFELAAREQVDGLIVLSDQFMVAYLQLIVDLAAAYRLPAMYGLRQWVASGGLMSYGANNRAAFKRAAYYVDRILKGAKPADLPVEQPREFEFVINLKTAQALRLTIPPHVLLQATEVVQ